MGGAFPITGAPRFQLPFGVGAVLPVGIAMVPAVRRCRVTEAPRPARV